MAESDELVREDPADAGACCDGVGVADAVAAGAAGGVALPGPMTVATTMEPMVTDGAIVAAGVPAAWRAGLGSVVAPTAVTSAAVAASTDTTIA